MTLASSVSSEDTLFVDEDERADLLGLSSEEDEDEAELDPPPAKRRCTVSAETCSSWKKITEKTLKNDRRKGLTNKFPCPASDWAHTPKLDDAIACIVPKSAKTYDRYLSKLQQFSMDALGPLLWLYDQRGEGHSDPDKVREALSAAISLVGNAAACFSTERRKSVMKHLNKDLRPLCEGKFPDRGPHLFGDSFGSRAKETADNIKALKGLKPVPRKNSQFFSGYGGPKGKEPQGRRYNWGKKPVAGQGQSIFSRLGAQSKSSQPSHTKKSSPKN